jgi:seryl-tRNA synthetase
MTQIKMIKTNILCKKMFSFLFGSTITTSEQRLEFALKEKKELEEQIKQLNVSLNAKEEEIFKVQKEIRNLTLPLVSVAVPPCPSIPVTAVLSQKSTGDVVSDFTLHFRPDMSSEERDQVMKKIREERQFRINLLPPAELIQTGFAAVMTELIRKCQSYSLS